MALNLAAAMPVFAGLLDEGEMIRFIPFTVRNADKPMIQATIAGKSGVLMIDNGTPDALFLNRTTLSLPKGRFVATGHAASGQAIEVEAHPAPPVEVCGKSVNLPNELRSGDFGFTAEALGDDFLGFVGTRMIENDAFLLDFARHQWVIFKVGQDGTLLAGSPQVSDVMVSVAFMIWPNEQPTIAALVGTLPMLTDFDTGDSGTLYVDAACREKLLQQKVLVADGERWLLQGLSVDGVHFKPTKVRIVEAGGKQDFRTAGHGNQLRLGAEFLAVNPCLWNYPAKTLTFLKPTAEFLGALQPPHPSTKH